MNNKSNKERLEIFSIFCIIILFVIYAIYQVFTGSGWLALATILTLILVLSFLIMGIDSGKEVYITLAGAITLSSMLHVFNASNVTKNDYIEKNVNLFSESLTIGNCPHSIQPDNKKIAEFNILRKQLMPKCMMQNHSETFTLAVDLFKAKNLDPITGLADNIYHDFNKKEELRCIEIAQKMNELCPGQYFQSVGL